MSLFQCSKCGCVENTALTKMSSTGVYWYNSEYEKGKSREALLSYKKLLGLLPDEKFTPLCSACCPVWFDYRGRFGIGENPNPTPGRGRWHGRFRRRYLPKGMYETDEEGSLRHKITKRHFM